MAVWPLLLFYLIYIFIAIDNVMGWIKKGRGAGEAMAIASKGVFLL